MPYDPFLEPNAPPKIPQAASGPPGGRNEPLDFLVQVFWSKQFFLLFGITLFYTLLGINKMFRKGVLGITSTFEAPPSFVPVVDNDLKNNKF